MQIALKKEIVKVSEPVVNQSETLLIEGDVIVPDVQPDIKEVLLTEATAVITNYSYKDGRLSFSGLIAAKILYLSDEEPCCPKTMEAKFDFKDVYELSCGENADLHVKASCEHIEFALINSRKLNVKFVVSAAIRGYRKRDMALYKPDGENPDFKVKTHEIAAYHTVADTTREIVISENLEIPTAKPEASELIKMNVHALKGDCKIMSGKMIVKGTLVVQSLYLNLEGGLELMEHEMPFSEMLEIDGLDEACLCNVSYEVKDVYSLLKEDANGECRLISMDAVLLADAIASKTEEALVVEDCYCVKGDLATKRETLLYEELLADGVSHLNLKEIVTLPESAPSADAVYSLSCKPKVVELSVENNTLMIRGKLTVFVLYGSAGSDIPAHSLVGEFDFTHSVPAAGADASAFCECGITDQNISFVMSATKEIELRCVLEFYTRVIKKREVSMVCSAEIDESVMQETHQGPVIYFVRPGDSLWNVAKHYRTDKESILTLNRLESETLYAGQKLLIPRK